MAYKQKRKYGFRDSLETGNPEKVIYGEYFDDEFEAIEQALADIDPDADGGVDIGEIDGLQDALDNKADKDHTHDEYLTDAPDDGKQYVRESEAWAEVTIPEAGIDEPADDGKPYSRQVEGGQVAGAWVEAPTTEDIESLGDRIDVIESGSSGGGMVISDSEPADKSEGMQWLNPTNGLVLFWDGDKWLQMPTTGAAGKDGVDGVDGSNGSDGADGADGAGLDANGNLDATKVTLGGWTIEEDGGELVFSNAGSAVAKITADGKIVGADDVTAFGI